jgi:hypothetical protein
MSLLNLSTHNRNPLCPALIPIPATVAVSRENIAVVNTATTRVNTATTRANTATTRASIAPIAVALVARMAASKRPRSPLRLDSGFASLSVA